MSPTEASRPEAGEDAAPEDAPDVGPESGEAQKVDATGWRGIGDRIRHLRVALMVSAVLAVVGAIVAALAGGDSAAAAAIWFAAGVALVAVSYTATTLAVAWADSVSPQLVFPVGVGMYVMKFSLLGVLIIAIGETEWDGRIPAATGIVLEVVVWTATQIWWTVRTAHPFVKVKT